MDKIKPIFEDWRSDFPRVIDCGYDVDVFDQIIESIIEGDITNPISSGGESFIWKHKNGNDVVKSTSTRLLGVSCDFEVNAEFWCRSLRMYNEVFPESKITPLAFCIIEGDSSYFLTTQKFVEGVYATREEINRDLRKRGFRPCVNVEHDYSNNIYFDGKYLIDDVRESNVIRGNDGKFYYIDVGCYIVNDPSKYEYIDDTEQRNGEGVDTIS